MKKTALVLKAQATGRGLAKPELSQVVAATLVVPAMEGVHRVLRCFGSCFRNRGRNAIADNIVAERFDSPMQRCSRAARVMWRDSFSRMCLRVALAAWRKGESVKASVISPA